MVILAAFILFSLIYFQRRRKPVALTVLPDSFREILIKHVTFYQNLDSERKTEFQNRMIRFLSHVRITGVKTNVEDVDKVFVASSAIIPIFGFKNWDYVNLNEVLLYPDSFGDEFEQEGQHRNTLGMVGTGALNNIMILSQHDLRQAFINKTGKENVAIHEFVHLVDKTDGSIDGVPEFLLEKRYVLPWLKMMQVKINEIIDDKSDINPYGATNDAEFFAVVSEYFFERPDLLRQKHPELYELLKKIFQPEPVQINSKSSS